MCRLAPPTAEELRAYIDEHAVPEPMSGCVLWIGYRNRKGYGLIQSWWGGRVHSLIAHRVAYSLGRGSIPDGRQLDHLCRVRSCVNPHHLEAVTCRVNVLRGVGVTAQLARTTHCIRGHEFTPENTYVRQGMRACRVCKYSRSRRSRLRLKLAGRSLAP